MCANETSLWREPIDGTMMKLLPSKVKIVKVKSFEPRVAMMALAGLIKFLPTLFILPDSKVGWYRPAYKKSLSLLREKQFDLIYSCAMPLTSNLVGLKLKKETRLPWVAHFSDPWVDSPYMRYGRLSYYVNERLERAVIEKADAIVFVSEETRQMVMKKYPPEVKCKSLVIPHCYDRELISLSSPSLKNSKFTFTYTGGFYGIRTPLVLFNAIHNILKRQPDIQNSINIQIVGRLHKHYQDAILKLGIEKVVSVVGVVPYLESLKYIQNADVLLVIDAPSEGPSVFLPSKLIEYVGFKKPILGITPLEGASASLIKRLGGIVVSLDDIAGIEQGILTFYRQFRAENMSDYLYSDKDIASYNAMNTTKDLAELFNRFC